MQTCLNTLVVLTLAGCGAAPKNGSSNKAPGGPSTQQPATPTPAAPLSVAVDTPADLPVCAATNDNQLVYVKSTQQLESCSSGVWAVDPLATQQQKPQLVNVVAEPAGKNCSDGGQAIETGNDTNGDGKLEASEVTNTSYVCNGTAGLSQTGIWTYHIDTYPTWTDPTNLEPSAVNQFISVFVGDIRLIEFSDGSGFVSVAGNTNAREPGYQNIEAYVAYDWSESFFVPAGTAANAFVFNFSQDESYLIRFDVTLGATPALGSAMVAVGTSWTGITDHIFTLTKN
jgi:hypothetical protein